MADVSIICKRTVTSIKPVEPRKFSPLSALAHIMENNNLRLVFYYKFPIKRRPGELTKKVRESMSEMLSAYPIVLGRLLRTPDGHWTIKCNDAGLRMVEARVEGTVKEWLQSVDREKELKLVYWEDTFYKPYFWSTFYAQITEFEGGGLAIGLSCTHLLSDPICATMMIKAWAGTTLRGEITSPPLFLPLPNRRQRNRSIDNQPYFHLIYHYKSAMQQSAPTSDRKHTTITLHFNQEKVESCMAMAGKETSLTPFDALAALFWTCISKGKGKRAGLVDMVVCLDMREKLGMEKSFFGNCMVYKRVQGDEAGEKNQVAKAATLIKETASRIDSDEAIDLMEWLETEKCKNPPWMNGAHLICVNLENVNAYSAVFGDGASPLRASYYIEPAVGPGLIAIHHQPEVTRRTVEWLQLHCQKVKLQGFLRSIDPAICPRNFNGVKESLLNGSFMCDSNNVIIKLLKFLQISCNCFEARFNSKWTTDLGCLNQNGLGPICPM